MITGLIFDRTAADVAHAQALLDKLASGVAYDDLTDAEKAEMQTGCRGCYNYTDLNRVQDATTTLAGLLEFYGYYNSIPAQHSSWSRNGVPTQADWRAYVGAVHNNRACFYVLADTPPLPAIGAPLDYVGANALEKTIYDQSVLLDRLIDAFRKSGTFAAGEDFAL